MTSYKVTKNDMPTLLTRFGLPNDADELEVSLLGEDKLCVTSVFSHPVRYHQVPNRIGCVQVGTRITITQQLPIDLPLYRSLRCLLEGVQ